MVKATVPSTIAPYRLSFLAGGLLTDKTAVVASVYLGAKETAAGTRTWLSAMCRSSCPRATWRSIWAMAYWLCFCFSMALVTIPAIEKKRKDVEQRTWPKNHLTREDA